MDRATRERIAKQFQKVTDESMVMNQLSPKFSDTGREVNLGEYLDAYTGAPVRTLARGLLRGSETPWKDAAKQFGNDPINAPTGKDIANDLGVSSKKLLELDKPLNSYGTIPSAIMSLASKIPRDEAAGFAIEQATDPTNFMAAAGKLPGIVGEVYVAGKKLPKKQAAEKVNELIDVAKKDKKYLYHGTTKEVAEDIGKSGGPLYPQKGKIVESAYGEYMTPEYNNAVEDAIFFSDKDPGFIGTSKIWNKPNMYEKSQDPKFIKKHGGLLLADKNDSRFYKRTDKDGFVNLADGTTESPFDNDNLPINVEPGDVISTESVSPDVVLTNDDLLEYLAKAYPEKYPLVKKSLDKGAKASPKIGKIKRTENGIDLQSKFGRGNLTHSSYDEMVQYDPTLEKLNFENPAKIEHVESYKKGTGSKILKRLEDEAKKADHDGIYLNASPLPKKDGTRLTKDQLVKFYEKNGYKVINDEGGNAVMYKKLSGGVGAVNKEGSTGLLAGKILEKYDTLDKVKAIRGTDEYAKYLKALDEVQGDVATRSKGMGFGEQDYFHATDAEFDKFDVSKIGSKTDEGFLGKGFYFSSDPKVISDKNLHGLPVKLKDQDVLEINYPSWGADKKKLISDASIRDHKTVRLNYSPVNYNHSEVMVKEPNQIRSKFAAFDPRFKDEADLLAGGIGTVNGKGLVGMAAGKVNKTTDDFDPDAYLADQSNDFDPDAYLASKQEKPMVTGEGLLRGTLKALPIAGSLAGGAMGTVLGPAGTLGGGMLGAAGGRALQNIGESMMGDEKTREDIYMGPVKDASLEAAGAGAGKLVGMAAGKVAPYVERGLLKPARDFFGKFGAQNKVGSEVLQEAGERIGVQPTRGMLTGEPVVQKIESGLAQTPTGAGQQVAEQLQSVQTGMKNAGEEVLTAGKTPETVQQMAQSAKEQVMGSIKKSIEPAAEIYRKIEGEARAIGVAEVSRKRISNNIRNVPYAKIKGSAESSFANQIADNLENVKSLEELRNLRSYVGKQLGDPNISSTMKETAGELYGRLGKLEQNSITRAALDAAANPQHGRSVATAMIGEIKQANKIYSQVSNELKEIAASTGMGKVNNYGDFIRKMEALPDEKFVSKLFTPGNVKNLKAVQKQFPEAFEVMRKSHLADLYNKSVTKGEVSIPKLIQNSRKLSKESKELIFGPKADQTLKDIETVYNATYQRVGPSGTPEGQAFMKFSPFSPTAWFNSMKASTTKWLLDNPELARKFAGAPATKQLYKNIPKEMSQQIMDETKKRFMYSTTPRATGLLMDANNE